MYTDYSKFTKKLKRASNKKVNKTVNKVVKAERTFYKLKSSNATWKNIRVDVAFAMRIVQRLSSILYEIADGPHPNKDKTNKNIRLLLALGNMELAYAETMLLFNVTKPQMAKAKVTYKSGITARKNKTIDLVKNPAKQTNAFENLEDYITYDISRLLDEIYSYTISGTVRKKVIIKYLTYWNQVDRVACKEMHKLSSIVSYPITRSLNAWLDITAEELRSRGYQIDIDPESDEEDADDYIDSSMLAGEGTLTNPFVVTSVDTIDNTAMYKKKKVILINKSYYKDKEGLLYYYYKYAFSNILKGNGSFEDPYKLSKVVIVATNGSTPVNLEKGKYYKIAGSTYRYDSNGVMTDCTVPDLEGDGSSSYPFKVNTVKQCGIADAGGYTITLDSGQYYKVKSTGIVYTLTVDGFIREAYKDDPEEDESGYGTTIPGVHGTGTKSNPFIATGISLSMQHVYYQNESGQAIDIPLINRSYYIKEGSVIKYKAIYVEEDGQSVLRIMYASEAELIEQENGDDKYSDISIGDEFILGKGTYDEPYVPDSINVEGNDVVFNNTSLNLKSVEFNNKYYKLQGDSKLYYVTDGVIAEHTEGSVPIEIPQPTGEGTPNNPYIVHEINTYTNTIVYKEVELPISTDGYNNKYYRTTNDARVYKVIEGVITRVLIGNGTITDPYVVSSIVLPYNLVQLDGEVIELENDHFYIEEGDESRKLYAVFDGQIMTKDSYDAAKQEQEDAEQESDQEGSAVIYGPPGSGTISDPYVVDYISLSMNNIIYNNKDVILEEGKYYRINNNSSLYVVNEGWIEYYGQAVSSSALKASKNAILSASSDDDDYYDEDDDDDDDDDTPKGSPTYIKLEGDGSETNPYRVDEVNIDDQYMTYKNAYVIIEDDKYYVDSDNILYVVFDNIIMTKSSMNTEIDNSGSVDNLPDEVEENPDTYTGVLKGQGTKTNPYLVSEVNTFTNDVIFEGNQIEPKDGCYYLTPDDNLYTFKYFKIYLAEDIDLTDENDDNIESYDDDIEDYYDTGDDNDDDFEYDE